MKNLKSTIVNANTVNFYMKKKTLETIEAHLKKKLRLDDSDLLKMSWTLLLHIYVYVQQNYAKGMKPVRDFLNSQIPNDSWTPNLLSLYKPAFKFIDYAREIADYKITLITDKNEEAYRLGLGIVQNSLKIEGFYCEHLLVSDFVSVIIPDAYGNSLEKISDIMYKKHGKFYTIKMIDIGTPPKQYLEQQIKALGNFKPSR